MTFLDSNSAERAAVQVWGKGYRVTADSEEFQRLVPPQHFESPPIEAGLPEIPWGRILESLYGLSERDLASQRAVLLQGSEVLALAFDHSQDRHGRPSMVMVSACATVDWDALVPRDTVSKTVALALRLASEYSRALATNPVSVGEQLREGTFLSSRVFTLSDELNDLGVDWRQVFAAARHFRGITGLATPKLVAVGANILLGTRHEAERLQQQREVRLDGFFDVREREIKPLSNALTPWKQAAQPPEPLPEMATPNPQQDLRPVVDALDRLERTIGRLVASVGTLIEFFVKPDRKKR